MRKEYLIFSLVFNLFFDNSIINHQIHSHYDWNTVSTLIGSLAIKPDYKNKLATYYAMKNNEDNDTFA